MLYFSFLVYSFLCKVKLIEQTFLELIKEQGYQHVKASTLPLYLRPLNGGLNRMKCLQNKLCTSSLPFSLPNCWMPWESGPLKQWEIYPRILLKHRSPDLYKKSPPNQNKIGFPALFIAILLRYGYNIRHNLSFK